LIEANCAPPDDAIRRASLEMVVEHSKSVRAIACVIEGAGFKASITRSVLAGMKLLLRVPVAVKFFGSAEDAAVWLSPAAQPRTARELAGAIEQLRAHFEDAQSQVATNE
jgi:hypothetical protein